MEGLLVLEQLEAVLFDAHHQRRVLVALVVVHDLVELLLQLEASGVHLKQTLSKLLWLHHLGLALRLSELSQLHLLLAKVLVDVQVRVVVVLLLERHQGVQLSHLLRALLATRSRQRLAVLLRLEDLPELVLTLLKILVVATLEAEYEVSLLFESHQQVFWRLYLAVWILLHLCEHAKSIVKAYIRNKIP